MARTPRPPVIAVMGHIDHGKSTLLDYIRKTSVTEGEAGGITQHVSAYIAEHNGRHVTFLDTPGHEAFKTLRMRGAAAADIAILVVAADEGVMPQTLDALAAIREAKIPFIVAITKIDKNNADVVRTKNSLIENGIYIEGMGGDVAYSQVSSKTGEGVPELLDLVLLATDLADISADPDAPAEGFVLESTQDSKRGASATLIVKNGTLAKGEFVVAGEAYAPIRFIENFRGERVEHSGPSEPGHISGFNKLPSAGAIFTVEKTKKKAEQLAQRSGDLAKSAAVQSASTEGVIELPLIIKADVAGSADAITHELAKIKHERATIRIVSSGVGNVGETDVKTAQASGAVIIAFNVGADTIARDLALREHIRIETFTIIYELSERIAKLLADKAPIISLEKELGRAEVVKTFSSGSKKQVIGARLISGVFAVNNRIKIVRKGEDVAHGTIRNLQLARADVNEINTDGTFGTEIEAKKDAAPGDELIAFVIVES